MNPINLTGMLIPEGVSMLPLCVEQQGYAGSNNVMRFNADSSVVSHSLMAGAGEGSQHGTTLTAYWEKKKKPQKKIT